MRSIQFTTFMGVLATASLAAASGLEPVTQDRRTLGDSVSFGDDGNVQHIEDHAADDFARFIDVLNTEALSGTAISTVESWQDSIIGSCGLVVAGGFHAVGSISPGDLHAYAIGFSGYRVDFDIDEASPFEVFGAFELHQQTRISIELQHEGEFLISDIVQGQDGPYMTTGELQPGRYRLSLNAFGSADTSQADNQTQDAHFRMQLRLCGPDEDLNGDGVVDVVDLLMLLDSWGACPGTPVGDCLADLDFSHAVDVQDLLKLLANWGS